MKSTRSFWSVTTALFMCFTFLAGCHQGKGDGAVPETPISTQDYFVHSNTYPSVEYSNKLSWWWRDCMVSGNGENGALIAANPLQEAIIYQNMKFNMPTNDVRETPDLANSIEGVRQNLINMQGPVTNWQIQNDYTFHPSHQLRIWSKDETPVSGFDRSTNYATAEVQVQYSQNGTKLFRNTFASRRDNVVITHIASENLTPMTLELSLDNIGDMAMDNEWSYLDNQLRYKKVAAEDASYIGQVAHYPAYENSELSEGGFAGITYVVTRGGTKTRLDNGSIRDSMAVSESKDYSIMINDAQEVFLITQSERDLNMGAYEDFAGANNYPLVEKLINHTKSVASNSEYFSDGFLSYKKMLAPHKTLHQKEFGAISFELSGDEADKKLFNEQLIEKQKQDKNSWKLNAAMAERAFYAGRYAAVCSSGYSTQRLGGMWTGAWGSRWQGDWTTDANVNLQIAGTNIGNMKDGLNGYINFILRIAPDFEKNAEKIYGMEDAIMAPPRTDGDRGSIVHFNGDYPFQFWNAGASWLLLPIFEHWLCYGNVNIPIARDIHLESLQSVLSMTKIDLTLTELETIKKRGYFRLAEDLLLPLLTKQANFWEQLVDARFYEDEQGAAHYDANKTALRGNEKYLILPSYSPENTTNGSYKNTVAINTTMDISAARDGLNMIVQIEKAVKRSGYEAAVKKWETLNSQLPQYKYDSEGSLKEWALDSYEESHGHRHISHTYAAWPSHEGQASEALRNGIDTSLKFRKNNSADKDSGHGWLHMGLVDARQKNSLGTEETLIQTLGNNAYNSAMMTNHNLSGNSAYVTDVLTTVPAVIMESLAYSNRGVIEILPALPKDMQSGVIRGMMARSEAMITELQWDLSKKQATVSVKSLKKQTLAVSCALAFSGAVINNKEQFINNGENKLEIDFQKGETVKIKFDLISLSDEIDSGNAKKITGEKFGRDQDSWECENPYALAFDGDGATYYDGQKAGFAGIQLSIESKLLGARFMPRQGFNDRCIGNQLQGSSDGVHWDTLYTVRQQPKNGFNDIYFKAMTAEQRPKKAYRYYRIFSGSSDYCNIAELELYS